MYGYPGTGKTSLATVIANEMDQKIKIVQGNSLQRPVDIINIVLTLSPGDFLFIDEIHSIHPSCIEILYSIMEDFVLDINIGKEFNSKITRINVPKFTLVGATTSIGKISQPLEDRFGIVINLGSYSDKELMQIITACNKKNKTTLSLDDIFEIAKNSKGIPRVGLRLYKRVCDFKIINPETKIQQIFQAIGIFENGIDENDILYMRTLKNNEKPLGVKSLCQTTGFDICSIEQKIEPNLLRLGFILKTALGRSLSDKGKQFINSHTK